MHQKRASLRPSVAVAAPLPCCLEGESLSRYPSLRTFIISCSFSCSQSTQAVFLKMKNAFLAVAFGAFVAVSASETPEKQDVNPEDLSALFTAEGGEIDWNNFSPEALGMHLNFDEMSSTELDKIVEAFKKLGLITPEESESFAASLTDPRMRNMIQSVTENWSETMAKIVKDPQYMKFLKSFQSSIDEQALATIVGLKDGLNGAIKGSEEE